MRLRFLSLLLTSHLFGFFNLSAQTGPAGEGDLKRDIAALRDAVIQQTRQIDALTSEVERLGIALGQRRPAKGAAPAAASEQPTVEIVPSGTTTAPLAAPVVAATPSPFAPNTLQHTVAKGDNLTNLAKKYNTTIEAIQKLNKITDARKMQVDQVLSIPMPIPIPAKSPTSPTASPTP